MFDRELSQARSSSAGYLIHVNMDCGGDELVRFPVKHHDAPVMCCINWLS